MKGDWYPITWNAKGEFNSTPVCLYYSTDNGASWIVIDEWIENTGHYNWTVPNVNTPGAMIKVTVKDIAGNEMQDTSDASFAIDPPPNEWKNDYTPPDDSTSQGGTENSDGDSGVREDKKSNPYLLPGVIILTVVLIVIILFNLIYITKLKNQKVAKTPQPDRTLRRGFNASGRTRSDVRGARRLQNQRMQLNRIRK
jgi:hypothetical protein